MIKFSCIYEKILLPLHRKFTKNLTNNQKKGEKNEKNLMQNPLSYVQGFQKNSNGAFELVG